MKICKKCGQKKSYSDFNYHEDNIDHLTGKCKVCLKEERKIREANRYQRIIPAVQKTCVRCNLTKLAENFASNLSCSDGLNGWCRDCSKDSVLLNKYSISLIDYNMLLKKQDFKCAICGTSEPLGNKNVFVVDHDHLTGNVRGLLCNHCNTGIGKLHDDPVLLRKAADYIENKR